MEDKNNLIIEYSKLGEKISKNLAIKYNVDADEIYSRFCLQLVKYIETIEKTIKEKQLEPRQYIIGMIKYICMGLYKEQIRNESISVTADGDYDQQDFLDNNYFVTEETPETTLLNRSNKEIKSKVDNIINLKDKVSRTVLFFKRLNNCKNAKYNFSKIIINPINNNIRNKIYYDAIVKNKCILWKTNIKKS